MMEKKALMNRAKKLNYSLTCHAECAMGTHSVLKVTEVGSRNRYACLIPAVILEQMSEGFQQLGTNKKWHTEAALCLVTVYCLSV